MGPMVDHHVKDVLKAVCVWNEKVQEKHLNEPGKQLPWQELCFNNYHYNNNTCDNDIKVTDVPVQYRELCVAQ